MKKVILLIALVMMLTISSVYTQKEISTEKTRKEQIDKSTVALNVIECDGAAYKIINR